MDPTANTDPAQGAPEVNPTPPETVKSISEGQRSVSFDSGSQSDLEILDKFHSRLKPYINRRGKVPSDVGKLCRCV